MGRKMVKKVWVCLFYIKSRKIFPTLLYRNVYPSLWWTTFPLYRFHCFGPIGKWKIPPFFSTVLPALARKLHPHHSLVSLVFLLQSSNSVLFQSTFCFRIQGVLPGIWSWVCKTVAKGRQRFPHLCSETHWDLPKSLEDLLQCFCPFLSSLVSVWMWSPTS